MCKNFGKILFLFLGVILPLFVLACAPTVLTREATNITSNSATLNGEVTDCGGCCQLSVWFEYGTTSAYGQEAERQAQYSTGSFSAEISNLSPCTTYHFRAVARNNRATGYGQDATFTTECLPPTVDLKAEGSDGPITLPYGSSVTLSWTSTNATECEASGDWLGQKSLSGTEIIENLTSSKIFILSCSGPGGTATDSVSVNINNPPQANAGPDKEVLEGGEIILEGSGSDPDGDEITFSWSCDGGSLSNSNVAQPTFFAPAVPQDTTYNCTLTVTDSHGAQASDTMSVLVKNQTLFVTLEATPNSGHAPLYDVDLKATVSGTATGSITYKFDCTGDGIWEYEFHNTTENPKTVLDACDYLTGGTFNAKVYVERGLSFPAWAQATIMVSSPYPVVDLKVENSDGPVTVPYNSSVDLSWTSENVDYCVASGNWSGTKSTSGSEEISNLTSSKTFTLTCYGPGGSTSDSVTVYLSSPSLYVSLTAFPSSGCAPLNNVDLTAEVSGTVSGKITYYFDCQNDGIFERIVNSYSTTYTASNLCNYSLPGTYIAKVKVERGGYSAQDTAQVLASDCYPKTLSLNEYVRNLSDGTSWKTEVDADPGEVLAFKIKIKAGPDFVPEVILKHSFSLLDKIKQIRNLKLDNVSISGDLSQGLNLGSFSGNQEKIVYFEAILEGASKFPFGQTQIRSQATAQFDSNSISDSVKINVRKVAVAGAATAAITGFVKKVFLDFIVLPLLISLSIIFVFKKHFLAFEEWIEYKKRKFREVAAQKILEAKIAQIRKKELKR